MRRTFALVAPVMLLCLAFAAQADVFNMDPGLTSLETVNVGDQGNPGELTGEGAGGYGPTVTCGAVGGGYKIGKYEVTAAQYCEFLNNKAQTDPLGLYNTKMSTNQYGCKIWRSGSGTLLDPYSYGVASDWANMPANYVSYWDALRFINWVNNGQGSASTETGAYTLSGYNSTDGRAIRRNAGAKWFLPSEDEWYKAAYYKGGGTNAGYWIYPTQSDTVPSSALVDPDPGNNATYNNDTIGAPYWRTEVGDHENSEGAYGTLDQAGNVWEWNQTLVDEAYPAYRGLRGGAWASTRDDLMSNGRGNYNTPTFENGATGFRVAGALPYGMSNRAAHEPIISTASARFSFKVWGRVTILGSDSFTLNDGSGAPVKVAAPGFGGIQDGDYASASGEFTGEGANRVLNSRAWDVVKLH